MERKGEKQKRTGNFGVNIVIHLVVFFNPRTNLVSLILPRTTTVYKVSFAISAKMNIAKYLVECFNITPKRVHCSAKFVLLEHEGLRAEGF